MAALTGAVTLPSVVAAGAVSAGPGVSITGAVTLPGLVGMGDMGPEVARVWVDLTVGRYRFS